jgi:hypothetical protein
MKPQEVTQNDVWFNQIYTSLPYTKVHSFEDSLLYYNVPIGHAELMTKEINDKIKELGLPLIAKSNASNQIFKDSIIIEPINK